jgi:hypothetical protein
MKGETLRKMKYRLGTALGDSKTYYTHSEATPIHGTGQGSCASPSIWLLISSILMDCLSELGGGMTMSDVMDETIQQWIDGFVDNTSLFVNIAPGDQDTNDVKRLHNLLRHDMIMWKELLEASGGKLELSKCFYYVMAWRFDDNGTPYPIAITEQRTMSNTISIPEGNTSENTTIEQKKSMKNIKH